MLTVGIFLVPNIGKSSFVLTTFAKQSKVHYNCVWFAIACYNKDIHSKFHNSFHLLLGISNIAGDISFTFD